MPDAISVASDPAVDLMERLVLFVTAHRFPRHLDLSGVAEHKRVSHLSTS
ncbi:hypothetical protein ACWGH8_33025 [Nonomuraea muscovyensis]